MAFSDMLGDDYWYFSLFSNNTSSSDLLRSMSFSVSRTQLHRRANTSYGIFRFSGQRYDIADPDVSVGYPVYWETMWGGFGSISYPISKFRRLAFSTGLAWSDKDIFIRAKSRRALLLSNAISIVHDNALYGMSGPKAGWRANLMVGYTTDLRYSNVNYYTVSLDLRKYFPVAPGVTLAARGLARVNQGKEARLHLLGGSWDLRGRVPTPRASHAAHTGPQALRRSPAALSARCPARARWWRSESDAGDSHRTGKLNKRRRRVAWRPGR